VDGFFIFVIIITKIKNEKYIVITLIVLSTALVSAQKKKNKRFKTVTTELRETGNFEVLEVEDNLEVYLEKDRNRNRD
jgi:hypothetical protein